MMTRVVILTDDEWRSLQKEAKEFKTALQHFTAEEKAYDKNLEAYEKKYHTHNLETLLKKTKENKEPLGSPPQRPSARPLIALVADTDLETKQETKENNGASQFVKDAARQYRIEGQLFEKRDKSQETKDQKIEVTVKQFVRKRWGDYTDEQFEQLWKTLNTHHFQNVVPSDYRHAIPYALRNHGDNIRCEMQYTVNFYRVDNVVHVRSISSYELFDGEDDIYKVPGTITTDFSLGDQGFFPTPGYPQFSNTLLKILCLGREKSIYLPPQAIALAEAEELVRAVYNSEFKELKSVQHATVLLKKLTEEFPVYLAKTDMKAMEKMTQELNALVPMLISEQEPVLQRRGTLESLAAEERKLILTPQQSQSLLAETKTHADRPFALMLKEIESKGGLVLPEGEERPFLRDMVRGGYGIEGRDIRNEVKGIEEMELEKQNHAVKAFIKKTWNLQNDQPIESLIKFHGQSFSQGLFNIAVLSSIKKSDDQALFLGKGKRNYTGNYYMKEGQIRVRIEASYPVHDESGLKFNLPGKTACEYELSSNGFRMVRTEFSNTLLKTMCLAKENSLHVSPEAIALAQTEEALRAVLRDDKLYNRPFISEFELKSIQAAKLVLTALELTLEQYLVNDDRAALSKLNAELKTVHAALQPPAPSSGLLSTAAGFFGGLFAQKDPKGEVRVDSKRNLFK